MQGRKYIHRKCFSLAGLSSSDWPIDSFQVNAFSDISSKKDLSQDCTPKRHVRNHSDVLFSNGCSFSAITPVEQRQSKSMLTECKEHLSKIGKLENENLRLQVELETTKRKNEELQEVLSAYDYKISVLLTRTTDCMGRVIKTKNSEISRLATCLNSRTDQFAAKLEAEAQKAKELQSASSFLSVKRLEKLLTQTKESNTRLSEEVKLLQVRAAVAEEEVKQCRLREQMQKQQADILESLSQQLEEVEKMQQTLQRENAVLRSGERQTIPAKCPQLELEVRQLCHMISRLRDLLEACRQGNLTQVLKGPEPANEGWRKELAQAKSDLAYIETQLLSWYSTLCGNECHIS